MSVYAPIPPPPYSPMHLPYPPNYIHDVSMIVHAHGVILIHADAYAAELQYSTPLSALCS